MENPIPVHNKQEYPPMHTAEHLLNRTMERMFGCPRSENAHIERRKSKITFTLAQEPAAEQVAAVVEQIQRLIDADLPVTYRMVRCADLTPSQQRRLPEGVPDEVRMVCIGDYDACPCIGLHVAHTAQLGRFVLLGTNWDAERHAFRIRFKLEGADGGDVPGGGAEAR